MNARYTDPQQNDFTTREEPLLDLLVDQRLLDLLVDGELPEGQRRGLLSSLDHKPDGWRRCALAFLEAQTWQRELGAVVPANGAAANGAAEDRASEDGASEDGAAGANVRRPIAVSSLAGTTVRAFYSPLALAASLLVAFVLGLAVRPATNDAPREGLGPQAAAQAGVHDAGDGSLARLTATRNDGRPTEAEYQRSTDEQPSGELATGRWGTVKLAIDDGPGGRPCEVELPAVESDSWDDSQLTSSPAVVPPALQQVFERLGHRVRQEREYVPFQLDDGRQMVVPVDKVSFTPVTSRAYQ
jgi:hypothetical protein